MSDSQLLLRQWSMLRLIPKFPRKVSARYLVESLSSEGFQVTKRTIERDLVCLSSSFPITSDERERPYGWSWAADAPQFTLAGLSISEAISMKLSEEYLERVLPSQILDNLRSYFKAAETTLINIKSENKLGVWPTKVAVVYPVQQLEIPKVALGIINIIEE